MYRALYSIEGDPSASRWHLAQQPMRVIASRLSALRVGGGTYRADQEFHDIGECLLQDAVRSRRPLVNAGQALPSNARVVTRSRKLDAE